MLVGRSWMELHESDLLHPDAWLLRDWSEVFVSAQLCVVGGSDRLFLAERSGACRSELDGVA